MKSRADPVLQVQNKVLKTNEDRSVMIGQTDLNLREGLEKGCPLSQIYRPHPSCSPRTRFFQSIRL